MQLRNTSHRYGAVAKLMHWSVLGLIIGLYVFEYFMHGLPPGDAKWMFYDLHKSFGVTLFSLVIARIGWRAVNPAPVPPPGIRPWQASAARINHALLYVALLIMPVTGYLGSVAGGFAVPFFGLFDLPAFLPENVDVNIAAEAVHAVTSDVLLALVGVHVAAALWHHFARRDDVLRRMLPFTAPASCVPRAPAAAEPAGS